MILGDGFLCWFLAGREIQMLRKYYFTGETKVAGWTVELGRLLDRQSEFIAAKIELQAERERARWSSGRMQMMSAQFAEKRLKTPDKLLILVGFNQLILSLSLSASPETLRSWKATICQQKHTGHRMGPPSERCLWTLAFTSIKRGEWKIIRKKAFYCTETLGDRVWVTRSRSLCVACWTVRLNAEVQSLNRFRNLQFFVAHTNLCNKCAVHLRGLGHAETLWSSLQLFGALCKADSLPFNPTSQSGQSWRKVASSSKFFQVLTRAAISLCAPRSGHLKSSSNQLKFRESR